MPEILVWLRDNSALVVALSTVVLTIITGVYAVANWRIVKAMGRDLKYRTQPHLEIRMHAGAVTAGQGTFEVTITAKRAAVRLESIEATLYWGSGPTEESRTVRINNVLGYSIPEDESKTFPGRFEFAGTFERWRVIVDFPDILNYSSYRISAVTGEANQLKAPEDRP